MKTSLRSQQLASVVTEVLPRILLGLTTPNQVGFLTVVMVEISGDLGIVLVRLSAIGAPAGWLQNIESKKKKIRYEILKQVELRREFELRLMAV